MNKEEVTAIIDNRYTDELPPALVRDKVDSNIEEDKAIVNRGQGKVNT